MPTAIHQQRNRTASAGFTLLEVSAAAAMLVVLLAVSVHIIALLAAQQKTAEQRSLALQATQNAIEQIESLPWDQVAPAAAERLKLPEHVRSQLPTARFAVSVTTEDAPVLAKRISVELTWSERAGRPGGPVRMSTWLFPDAGTQ